MDNEISVLKKQIKEKKTGSLYLFFGDEKYLQELYMKQISELVPDAGFPEFNRFVIDGADASLSDVTDAVETFPMMTDKKLVIVTDSGAFSAKASSEIKEYYISVFEKLTDDTVLILRENNVDKRSTVYKSAKKHGLAVEFKQLSDTDLVAWIIRRAGKVGKKISRQNAELLVATCEKGLGTLENEIVKLTAYCDEEITEPIIKRLASKSIEAKVFDLSDHIMSKNADKALSLLRSLKLDTSATPIGMLALLYSSFEKVLKVQILMKSNMSKKDISATVSVPFWIIDKYISAAKNFSERELTDLLILIPELDLSIKRGEIEQWKAVDKLVFKGIGKNV